jgi:ProQ/FINO family
MTITKQDMDAALARLTEAFPQTFVLEKYRPHRPLKIGIAADIRARCPELERRVLSVALNSMPGASCICKASSPVLPASTSTAPQQAR